MTQEEIKPEDSPKPAEMPAEPQPESPTEAVQAPQESPVEAQPPVAPETSTQEIPVETVPQVSPTSTEEAKPEVAMPEPAPATPPSAMPDFRVIMQEAKKKRYEARLAKVLDLAREKGKITNDDIQKLLRVSDATATRHAKTLINRGLLKKSGKTRSSHYELA